MLLIGKMVAGVGMELQSQFLPPEAPDGMREDAPRNKVRDIECSLKQASGKPTSTLSTKMSNNGSCLHVLIAYKVVGRRTGQWYLLPVLVCHPEPAIALGGVVGGGWQSGEDSSRYSLALPFRYSVPSWRNTFFLHDLGQPTLAPSPIGSVPVNTASVPSRVFTNGPLPRLDPVVSDLTRVCAITVVG